MAFVKYEIRELVRICGSFIDCIQDHVEFYSRFGRRATNSHLSFRAFHLQRFGFESQFATARSRPTAARFSYETPVGFSIKFSLFHPHIN